MSTLYVDDAAVVVAIGDRLAGRAALTSGARQ